MSTVASRQYNWVTDKNAGVPITASRMDAEFDNCITKLNQKVIISAAAPASPIAGMLWLDSTNKVLKQYRNSEWVVNGIVHVGTAAPATVQEGDLWYDTTNNLLESYNGSAWGKHLSFPNNSMGNLFWVSTTDTIGTIPSAVAGNVLLAKGVGSMPDYGKVNVESMVVGTLPSANGGTGASKFEYGYNVATLATTETPVVFSSNFLNTLYAVVIIGRQTTTPHGVSVKSKSANSFIAWTDQADTLDWIAVGPKA